MYDCDIQLLLFCQKKGGGDKQQSSEGKKAPSASANKATTGEGSGQEKEVVQLVGEALNFHKPGTVCDETIADFPSRPDGMKWGNNVTHPSTYYQLLFRFVDI